MNYVKPIEIINLADDSEFEVSPHAKFLKDKECYRVSVGIVAVHLTNEFAQWLKNNPCFTFKELAKISHIQHEELKLILNMLIKNTIINIVR